MPKVQHSVVLSPKYGSEILYSSPCVVLFVTELCPQSANVTCNGEYAITQNDIDDGMVLNTGTVSCVDSEANQIVVQDNSTVDLLGTPSVSLGKHSFRDRV